uniref:FERM domain-containing protein 8 n=1 Tax=Arion vulgaris TaxID=1028688 RepID=A0A0B7AES9_9EUPU
MAEKKERMNRDESLDEEPGERNQLLMQEYNIDDVMSLVVFLRDKTGIHFTLEDAPITQCSGLLQLVILEQNLPQEASDVLCLWLISPVLELRLKKHHNPFQVVQKWDELCALYTDASFDEIHQSEPVLMVQRDVFVSKEQEQQIQNEQILSLLYHEGKYKVIEGRYILHEEDYHYLAGLQALIQFGTYKPTQHVLAEYRSNLDKFYPDHMYVQSRFRFLNRSHLNQTPCEESFMEAHIRISEELQHIASNLTQLYRKYLAVLWTYPFYGGAFFNGYVETKMTGIRRFILPKSDMRVSICINTEGVSIFNTEKDEFLLYVPFAEMSWKYQDHPWDGDNDPPPTLMLQFICDEKHEESQGQPVTKLLQIYSKEAKLMDALIATCVRRKLETWKNQGDDFVDAGIIESSVKKMLNKLDRLSLETYTQDGDQLDVV